MNHIFGVTELIRGNCITNHSPGLPGSCFRFDIDLPSLIKNGFKVSEKQKFWGIGACTGAPPPCQPWRKALICSKSAPDYLCVSASRGRNRYDKVERNADLLDFPVQELGRVSAMRTFRYHYQEIDVTFGVRFTPRRGTEENDAQRPRKPDDIPGKLFYGRNVGFHRS
uniref:Uncharacterized protein n=1 Tax=Candidatus Kentrum sp. TUN TaxID=2126343 RepID=A0A450ZZU4_9GAMM|nr:MAG: hypothetical protein BECKTUN1418F_GA0071002_105016 [Candidatus Kentron sp. TUN]VFK59304.1 MAG: hypothetical protein BECKTUN1418E_GA0071001_10532 [Candidatus Kentron sp. TUN]